MSKVSGKNGGVHRVRDFRRLWLSNISQEVGRQFGALALSVTAVVVLDAVAWQVGLITAVGTSAYLLIGLPAGVWVDRWRKRPVLVTADLLRAGATLSVPIAYAGGPVDHRTPRIGCGGHQFHIRVLR